MKRKIVTLTTLVVAMSAFAIDKIQVQFQYEDGIYNGLTYKGIIAEEEDFIKDQSNYEGRFFEGIEDNILAYKPDTIVENEDLIIIKVLQVKRNGNLKADVTYIDAKSKNNTTKTLQSRGGTFGTFLNLFGDGMKNLGKQVSKWLK